MKALDTRLNPARPDLAAAFLRGKVEAARFVPGEPRTVVTPTAPVRRKPDPACPLDTEALRGEDVTVYEETPECWAWVQLARDGYVGYMPAAALGSPHVATDRVAALRTLVFPGPNLKLPVTGALTLGSRLAVTGRTAGFAAVPEGYVWAGHLAPLDTHDADFVAVAERFLGVPYLWGGRSSFGLDCSGLVQVSLGATGREAPRDSDMQEAGLGTALSIDDPLRRGDLVFWRGHVGIMRDPVTLLHANAHAMMVASEPLAAARARIATRTGVDVTGIRRL